MKSLYNHPEWISFRDAILEADSYKCRECGRGKEKVILQVHHIRYESGKKPWEYPPDSCITLCKGCHAITHKIIRPSVGWIYDEYCDLGDLIGKCDACGKPLRHLHYVYHNEWPGYLEVGALCADNLTDTKLASNRQDSSVKEKRRLDNFVKSNKWIYYSETHTIFYHYYQVDIRLNDNRVHEIWCNDLRLKSRFNTLIEAKEKVFYLIESGDLSQFLLSNPSKYKIPTQESCKERKKSLSAKLGIKIS